MIFQILSVLFLSIGSGYLYHLGGINHLLRPNIPLIRQKPRDVGCSLLVLLGMLLMGIKGPWWVWLFTFGLTWGSLSTYFDEFPLNWMKPEDNHWMHGFFIGLSTLPYSIHTQLIGDPIWFPLLLRALVSGVLIGLWSKYTPNFIVKISKKLISDKIDEARVEEFGRGFLTTLTLLFYL